MANDDELAERNVTRIDSVHAKPPAVSEFTLIAELLAAIYDRQGQQITATIAVAGAKHPPKLRPFPRPVTALQRAQDRRAKADFDDIVALATPHEVDRLT